MSSGQGYQNQSERLLGRAEKSFGSLGAGGSGLTSYGQGLGSRQRKTYEPLNRRIVQSAELNPDDLVDQASIDTGQAYNKARGIQDRRLSRMGVDPSSGKFQGLQQQLSLAQAAAEAGARTRARRTGRRESFGRQMQAASLGQNLSGQALSAMRSGAGLSGQAGQGFRNLGADYGSIAASEEEAGTLGSFQNDMNSIFGGNPQPGLTSGYNPGGFSGFQRGFAGSGGGGGGGSSLPADKSTFFTRENPFFSRSRAQDALKKK